jgi:hypothetical protein
VLYERGSGHGDRLLETIREEVAARPALFAGTAVEVPSNFRGFIGRTFEPGAVEPEIDAPVVAVLTGALRDLCGAHLVDFAIATDDLWERGLIVGTSEVEDGRRTVRRKRQLRLNGAGLRAFHFVISTSENPTGYTGYTGYTPAQVPFSGVSGAREKLSPGYTQKEAPTCGVPGVSGVSGGFFNHANTQNGGEPDALDQAGAELPAVLESRYRRESAGLDSAHRFELLHNLRTEARAMAEGDSEPAYEVGPQASYLDWIGGLIDSADAEGEAVDWLGLSADETAELAGTVTRNLAELVSAKRMIEDPDAPRAPEPPPPLDPLDPEVIETAAAWEALHPELFPAGGAVVVPSTTTAAPVEAPSEALQSPESPARAIRTRKPAESPTRGPGRLNAKPRTKPESAPRGYVPLATDGRVIVAPDGSRRELPVPVEVLDAGHVAEAARELSAGRPAVVLVSARAHDALGLGDTWAPEPEASAAEALDAHPLAARAIARGVPVVLASTASGALAVGESHAERVEIDFPRWSGSGDFRAVETLDLDQLESAAVKFAAALGLTYATSGAATITHLIRNLSPKLGPAWLEPDLSDDSRPSWVRAKPGGGWSRKLTKAESGRPYVAVYDRSGSYASAWGGLVTGTGRWEQAGAVAELPGRDTPAGYWLVDVEPLRVALKLGSAKPDPFAKLGAPNGPQWLTTPLAQLARDLTNALGLDLRALDAYTQAAHGRALTKPAERIRAAREALALDPSPAARAALAIVKTGYSAALGWCEYSNRPPDPLARPYWNRAVIDRFGANAWRSLETAEPAPFAWVDIDACLFATGDSSMAPWPPEKIGPGFGCWKRKGALVSMKEAAPLLNAGNVQAVVALAEEKDK